MSPFNVYRKGFITVCLVTAVIVAFVTGFKHPAFDSMTDGFIHPTLISISDSLVYAVLLFTAVLVLWNIFQYAIPTHYTHTYRIIALTAFAIVTCLYINGIETLAIYLCFPASFPSFLSTLPVRLLITALLYIIIYLSFLYYEKFEFNRKSHENVPIIAKNDESIGDIVEKSDFDGFTNATPTSLPDRITVRTGQKIKIIPFSSILFIKADGDYISIRTAEGSWLKEQTMKYTEDRLPIDSFVRIHRSYIVNIHQISRIERYGEQQLIVLYNNEKIKISAARYHALKQILGI